METNLEDLIRSYLHVYVTEEVSSKFLPLIQGFKIGLLCQEFFYGQR